MLSPAVTGNRELHPGVSQGDRDSHIEPLTACQVAHQQEAGLRSKAWIGSQGPKYGMWIAQTTALLKA